MKYTYTIQFGGSEYSAVVSSDEELQLVGDENISFVAVGNNWFNANYVMSITCTNNNRGN